MKEINSKSRLFPLSETREEGIQGGGGGFRGPDPSDKIRKTWTTPDGRIHYTMDGAHWFWRGAKLFVVVFSWDNKEFWH